MGICMPALTRPPPLPPSAPPDVCRFSSLTSLELPAVGSGPQLLLELAQRLPHLQQLVLNDVSGEQCELLPRLAELSALSSLSLATVHHTAGLPLTPLLALLSDSSCRLRQLSLTAQYGFDQHLPLALLSGLESLSLALAEVQVRGCALQARGLCFSSVGCLC